MRTLAILDETVVPFGKGTNKALKGHPSRYQLDSWVRRGIRGITLEYCRVGGKPVTSKEAVLRFLKLTNGE